ncbi:hypothetical protein [Streptomyces sp. DSM 15324]|uniref:hypothetical protein n=1 Tax=Streptomyces sp. DSM 15324 TaxID=1739111 RepID=UPI00074AC227|nr:hypothetical protein [Streptomyces sp. DSM 15324]KUO12082.1 hypothetical protein AQJ58_13190 [Streptomyces sp. DSM 15324]
MRIELRRSVAPWAGGVVLTTALAFLYLLRGTFDQGTTAWTAQWTPMALWLRSLLFYLWPLAVGLGALQGLRDHRSKMSELLTSTPRPARHRAAALAGTTAAALTSAFALLVLVGGVQVLAHTSYTHLGWLPISLVGAFSLVAGSVLGMGAARALPSVLTPPLVTVGAFALTVLMQLSWGRTQRDTPMGIPVSEPNRLSLLSPAVQDVRDPFTTLSAVAHLGQTVWLLGMAVTGFALLVAARRRTRLLAVAPVLAGAALALLVLPTDPDRLFVVDKTAAEPVCDGPVCVTRTQQGRLADVAGPGRKALSLLHAALGDRAPVEVRESAAVLPEGSMPKWSGRTVPLDFDDAGIVGAKGEDMTVALVGKGLVPGCSPVGWSGTGGEDVARTVAAGWVLGDLVSLPQVSEKLRRYVDTEARPVWKEFRTLPEAEQRARIDAMRTAALSCEGDALEALRKTGGASR